VLLIECNSPGCHGRAFADCLPGCADVAGAHLDGCPVADLDALVTCPDPAATGCCTADHHHGQAANACPGIPDDAHACGKDNPACTVCRPVTITVMPGSVAVTPAGR
jgi:hypothetical protein